MEGVDSDEPLSQQQIEEMKKKHAETEGFGKVRDKNIIIPRCYER